MKTINLDLFKQFSYLSALEKNKAETALFLVEARASKDDAGYDQRLWTVDLDNEKPRLLTPWRKDCSYVVLNDGLALLEHKPETPGTTVSLLNEKTGAPLHSVSLPLAVMTVEDLDDSHWILKTASSKYHPDDDQETPGEREERLETEKKDEHVYVFDEFPYIFNGRGVINGSRSALYIYNKDTKLLTRVSDAYCGVQSYDFFDGTLYYAGTSYKDAHRFRSMIYAYDLKTQTATELLDEPAIINQLFHKNGKLLAIGTYGERYSLNENPQVCEVKDGKLNVLYDPDATFHGGGVTDVHFGFYHQNRFDRTAELYETLQTNWDKVVISELTETELSEKVRIDGIIDDFVHIGDTYYFLAMKDMKLEELYKYKDGELKQLTSFNEEVLKDRYVAEAHPIRVDKEMPLEGWVLLPKDYSPLKTYPAILDIHGGPMASYAPIYVHEMQVWANAGFFVFFTNIRGSSGRGNAFGDLKKGWGTIDYEDLMDFTDAVLRIYPGIDPKRLCVTGGSYGGYMTNWIITQTDRFAAAATQRSISNWISELLVSDMGLTFIEEMGLEGLSWDETVQELWRISPLKYVDQAKTPTLFIHSDEDYRCPIPEGMQLFTYLKTHGVDSKMVVFRGENHELSRSGKPYNRERRLQEITDWFLKYTKKGEEYYGL